MPKTLTMYRPVGLKEAELSLDSGCSAFPPRLPDHPIFYPVMNTEYARQIARDWNTPDAGSGHAGFVTAFDVGADYASRFPVRTVGNSLHQELWVPAEELAPSISTSKAPCASRKPGTAPATSVRTPRSVLLSASSWPCLSRAATPCH